MKANRLILLLPGLLLLSGCVALPELQMSFSSDSDIQNNSSSSSYPDSEPDLVFELVDNDHYVIAGTTNSEVETLRIPSTHEGLPVTGIEHLQPRENGPELPKLKNIYISENIKTFGLIHLDTHPYSRAYGVFYYLPKLEQIIVDSNNQNYSSNNGVLFTKNGQTLIYVPISYSQKTYKTPKSVKEIYNGAFYNNKTIEEVVVNRGVTKLGTLGDGVFTSTYLLSKIYLPDTIETIEDSIVFTWTGWDFAQKTFYCQAETKPEGWSDRWNLYYSEGNNGLMPSHYCNVLWSQENDYWAS